MPCRSPPRSALEPIESILGIRMDLSRLPNRELVKQLVRAKPDDPLWREFVSRFGSRIRLVVLRSFETEQVRSPTLDAGSGRGPDPGSLRQAAGRRTASAQPISRSERSLDLHLPECHRRQYGARSLQEASGSEDAPGDDVAVERHPERAERKHPRLRAIPHQRRSWSGPLRRLPRAAGGHHVSAGRDLTRRHHGSGSPRISSLLHRGASPWTRSPGAGRLAFLRVESKNVFGACAPPLKIIFLSNRGRSKGRKVVFE